MLPQRQAADMAWGPRVAVALLGAAAGAPSLSMTHAPRPRNAAPCNDGENRTASRIEASRLVRAPPWRALTARAPPA